MQRFIVFGTVGHYSDRKIWPIKIVGSKERAEKLCGEFSDAFRVFGQNHKDRFMDEMREPWAPNVEYLSLYFDEDGVPACSSEVRFYYEKCEEES